MNTDLPPMDLFDFDCHRDCCSQVFRQVVSCLSAHGMSDEARALARWVFELRFGIGQIQLLTDKDSYFSEKERYELLFIVHRLLQGEPIQYILGFAPFCGMKVRVCPGVLIPRPETEELVAWIVSDMRAGISDTEPYVLDIGTGSGCIALALARELPQARVSGMDISEPALEVARQNAVSLGLHVEFFRQDILHENTSSGRKWHVMVSNPPYICASEAQQMERNVLDHEPHQALFVPDDDPLLFYRAIARYAREALFPGGRLYFEINRAYVVETVRLLEGSGFSGVEVRKDQFGNNRMVGCRLDSLVSE